MIDIARSSDQTKFKKCHRPPSPASSSACDLQTRDWLHESESSFKLTSCGRRANTDTRPARLGCGTPPSTPHTSAAERWGRAGRWGVGGWWWGGDTQGYRRNDTQQQSRRYRRGHKSQQLKGICVPLRPRPLFHFTAPTFLTGGRQLTPSRLSFFPAPFSTTCRTERRGEA